LPLDKDDNKEYQRRNHSKAREDVVVLGTSGFNEKLVAIDYEIRDQVSTITDAEERIQSVRDVDDPELITEYEEAEQDLQKAKKGLKALRALRDEIAPYWRVERRVFGELAWAPPIVLSNPVSTPWTLPSSRSMRASLTPKTTAATAST
jgi:hypothetical protein